MLTKSHFILNFTEELHTPYTCMVTKRRCVWNKTFPLGHFMLYFTIFIMFLYIREMTTKASNVHEHFFTLKKYIVSLTASDHFFQCQSSAVNQA